MNEVEATLAVAEVDSSWCGCMPLTDENGLPLVEPWDGEHVCWGDPDPLAEHIDVGD